MGRGSKNGVKCCEPRSSSSSSSSSSLSSSSGSDKQCGHCLSGDAPDRYKVTIAGMANDTCLSCASLDGDYILSYNFFETCCWAYNFPDTAICSNNYSRIQLDAVSLGGSSFRLQVTIGKYAPLSHVCAIGTPQIVLAKTYTDFADCYNINGDVLTFFSATLNLCNPAAATATVTSL